MKSALEIARAFLIMYSRDRMSLFFGFFFNALLMVVLGLSIEDRFNIQIKLAIASQVEAAASARLTDELAKQPNVDVIWVRSETEAAEHVRSGDAVAALVLEKAEPANPGEPGVRVRVLGDPARGAWLKLMIPGLKLAILQLDEGLAEKVSKADVRVEDVPSRNRRYFDFIFPGVLAFSLMQLGLFGGLSLLHFKNNESLKRLKLTNLTRAQFLSGYALSRLVLLCIQVLLYYAVAAIGFGYRFTGPVWQAVLVLLVGGSLFVTIGVLIGGVMNSPETGNNLLRFLNYPAAFLCGVFVPRTSLPGHLSLLAQFYPVTYVVDSLRDIAYHDAMSRASYQGVLLLMGLTLVLGALAARFFRWDEERA